MKVFKEKWFEILCATLILTAYTIYMITLAL